MSEKVIWDCVFFLAGAATFFVGFFLGRKRGRVG